MHKLSVITLAITEERNQRGKSEEASPPTKVGHTSNRIVTFTSEVDRNYDDQFAVVGAKIGNTVNVRRPGRFIGTTGPALNVEDFNETSVPVTLSTQFHVDTQFTTQDLALSLDMFSDRVLKPAVNSSGLVH